MNRTMAAKFIIFCCGWMLAAPMTASANSFTPESKIVKVIVYPGSSHVTREAKVNLSAGEHSIVLEGIIPNIDENTLTVEGQGTAKVKLFGAYIKYEYLKEAADVRVKELQKKIEVVDDEQLVLNNRIQVLKQEREFLASVKLFAGQQLPKSLVTTMPSANNLEETRKFLTDSLQQNEDKTNEIRLKLRDLERQKQSLLEELSRLNSGGQKMKRSVIVDLACEKAGDFTLDVGYLLAGANWRPLYDARADFAKNEVELTAFGVVSQNTGEDWENVNLTLSTAQPLRGGRMPYIAPWILQEYRPQAQNSLWEEGKMRKMMVASQDMAFNQDARSGAEAESAVAAPAALDLANVVQGGLSVEFKIARPATIKSDNAENKFPVVTQKLAANFEYSAFPRATQTAYLGSRVTNAGDLQLLAGQVNLFLDNNFVGKSSIDNIAPGQEFDLYLGVDDSVKVKREEIARKVDDIFLGMPAANKKTTITYKITLENYKGKKIRVLLFDAMPVSQTEKIKAKVVDVSAEPKQKDWLDRKGVWKWEFDLEPRGKQEIKYSIVIEHPKDLSIAGF